MAGLSRFRAAELKKIIYACSYRIPQEVASVIRDAFKGGLPMAMETSCGFLTSWFLRGGSYLA
jgi:hypothetical protein